MSEKFLLQVGDVIKSPDFAYGSKIPPETGHIYVDGKTMHETAEIATDEEERLEVAAKTGAILPKYKTIDLGAFDPTRGTAEFVVEYAEMEGADDRNGISDSLHILARRLDRSGLYNAGGQVINFYVDSGHGNSVPHDHIRLVRKMKKKFV